MAPLNISWPLAINASGQTIRNRGRECSKKHALCPLEGFVQSSSERSRRKGRSPFGAQSVLSVREHGKMERTPLAAFFNISNGDARGCCRREVGFNPMENRSEVDG